jgi:hypothetical protein
VREISIEELATPSVIIVAGGYPEIIKMYLSPKEAAIRKNVKTELLTAFSYLFIGSITPKFFDVTYKTLSIEICITMSGLVKMKIRLEADCKYFNHALCFNCINSCLISSIYFSNEFSLSKLNRI